jgi:coproporphyrinogen III oxidase
VRINLIFARVFDSHKMIDKKEIENYFRSLQDAICKGLEQADGKAKFIEDLWVRSEGGGGRTRVIKDGNVIEKGGVNFSAVFGPCPEFLKKEIGVPLTDKLDFLATGVSIVIHPVNPFVPIIHMNVRYFEAGNTSWFGGGIDLTPHYIYEEDAKAFHDLLKRACDKHNATYYPEFKKWADDYFFIPHRNETRGVGGIFFDKLSAKGDITLEHVYAFVKSVGESFLPAYLPLIEKYKSKKYSEDNRQWQLLRRGRYTEFNLVYDRGTKFGLFTNGRTESILMSLPPLARWEYNAVPMAGSHEEKTLNLLKKGIPWAN